MIELKDLQKVIDQNTVIDVEALQMEAGQSAALVGPVDSGRETPLELLTGRSRPTAGEVLLVGSDPLADKVHFSRKVGVLFPEDNLYTRMSSEGNLKFYNRLQRLPKPRAREVIKKVGSTMLLIVVLVGALFANMLGMATPPVVQAMLPLVPSVALAEIIRFVFLETVPWGQVLANLGSVLAISTLLYAVGVWKVRRSDRQL